MTTQPTHCVILGCGEPLSARSRLPMCPNCRALIGSWKKRRPAEGLERRRRLRKYDNRMAELVSLKVVHIASPPRRKAGK